MGIAYPIIPTLRVACVDVGTRSVPGGVPTQSVGTISNDQSTTLNSSLAVWPASSNTLS